MAEEKTAEHEHFNPFLLAEVDQFESDDMLASDLYSSESDDETGAIQRNMLEDVEEANSQEEEDFAGNAKRVSKLQSLDGLNTIQSSGQANERFNDLNSYEPMHQDRKQSMKEGKKMLKQTKELRAQSKSTASDKVVESSLTQAQFQNQSSNEQAQLLASLVEQVRTLGEQQAQQNAHFFGVVDEMKKRIDENGNTTQRILESVTHREAGE